MDFLQNPEIIKLLPDLHRRLFEELKKCKDAANPSDGDQNGSGGASGGASAVPADTEWGSAQNIERILRTLLDSESKFGAITGHPLYAQKLDGMIPHLCRKMAAHLPILMSFSTEAIAAWIPHLASVLGHGFNTFDSFGSSAMSSFFPLMCSFMTRQGDFRQFQGNVDRDRDGNVLHFGVQCDQCNVSPIKVCHIFAIFCWFTLILSLSGSF